MSEWWKDSLLNGVTKKVPLWSIPPRWIPPDQIALKMLPNPWPNLLMGGFFGHLEMKDVKILI